MSVVYRSILELPTGRAPGNIAEDAFTGWLEEKNAGPYPLPQEVVVPSETGTSGEGAVSVHRMDGQDATGTASRIVLDQREGEVRWQTSLTVWDDKGKASPDQMWASVEVTHTSRRPWDRPPRRAVPRLIDHILALDGVRLDGAPVHEEPWRAVSASDATAVVSWIRSEQRSVPIHVIGHGVGSGSEAGSEAARKAHILTRGQALTVVVVNDTAQDAFIDEIGRENAVWGGALRTYLPVRHDGVLDPRRHRYVPARRILEWHGRPWAWDRWADRLAAGANARALPQGQADRLSDMLSRPGEPEADEERLRELMSAAAESEELVFELITNRDSLLGDVTQLREEGRNHLDRIDALSAEVDKLERRLQWVSLKAAVPLGTPDDPLHEVDEPPDFDTKVDELFGRDWARVVLGEGFMEVVELSAYEGRDRWLERAEWVLFELERYAEAKSNGAFDHGLAKWMEDEANIPVTYAETEKGMTKDLSAAAAARTFEVPREALADPPDEDEKPTVVMWSHFKIGGGGPPAPRMHIHDATRIDGRVYVGYLGPHLVTAGTARL